MLGLRNWEVQSFPIAQASFHFQLSDFKSPWMYYARRGKKDYVERTFLTYKMLYKFLIDIIIQGWETQHLESTQGTQISGSHKMLQIRSYRESKEGKIIRWTEDEEKLFGEGGIRYGHIRMK